MVLLKGSRLKLREMARKKIANYYKSRTSPKWKKIGDAMLIIGGIADIISDLPSWGHKTLVLIAVTGKLITNFFTDDPTVQEDGE